MRSNAMLALLGLGAVGVAAAFSCSSKSNEHAGGSTSRATGGAGGTDAGGESASSTSATTGSGGGGAKPDPSGVFVAVGNGGRRIRSIDDGTTWTDDVSLGSDGGGGGGGGGGSNEALTLHTVGFGHGLFVAAGLRLMTSPDGATWSDTPPESFKQNVLSQIVYGDGVYVGIGGNGSRISSPDAAVWSEHAIDAKSSSRIGGIAFGTNRGFVSVNDAGKISHAGDGKTWAFTNAAISTNGLGVAFGNNRFVAVGGGGFLVSFDGVEWSAYESFPGGGLRAVVFGQSHFSALTSGAVYTSTDGDFWSEALAPELVLDVAAYGHGTYVAFEGTRVRRSTNGIKWSDPVELGGTNTFLAVTFGPDGE